MNTIPTSPNVPTLPASATRAIEDLLEQAIACHRQGLLEDAERHYRSILQSGLSHPDVNHNLGVLVVSRMNAADGLPYFVAALEADPTQAQYWLSYIDCLFRAGQFGLAGQVLEHARGQGLAGEPMEQLAARLDAALLGSDPAVPADALLPAIAPSPETCTAGSDVATKKRAESAKAPRKPLSRRAAQPRPQETSALIALFEAGRYAEAASAATTMTTRFPLHHLGWIVLGAACNQMDRPADALAPMQKALSLSPGNFDAHNILGVTFNELGRLDESEASCRKAIRIRPDFAEAHNNLGNTLHAQGRLEEAEVSYRRALRRKPAYPKALCGLGTVLYGQGRLNDAEASFRRALEIQESYAEAHNNLASTLHSLNRSDEAQVHYERAIEIRPHFIDALNNLAVLFNANGKSQNALATVQRALQIEETAESKKLFVACVSRLDCAVDNEAMRATLIRALTEPWGRPRNLARVASDLIRRGASLGECIGRASEAWPKRLSAPELFGPAGPVALASDPLLNALLESVPVADIEIEHFLTLARHALLDAAPSLIAAPTPSEAVLTALSALARQCFINEYVFSQTPDEISKASDLRASLAAALADGDAVPAILPLVVAAYFPLYSVPLAERLLSANWPLSVSAVVDQQIREPAEEQRLRAGIARLTGVDDDISLQVQTQYEENPYPRWIKSDPAESAKNVDQFFCQRFPLAGFTRQGKRGAIDVLVAGCGTGQHSIGTAQQFSGARVLAVDLSLSSLCYAERKTRELGIGNIEYAQADLLQLGSLGRSFDIIESVGVLHHLADPWQGWRVLVDLLRPGGCMKLGFYSEIARRNVVRVRALISERGYGTSADDIRRCRADLVELDAREHFGTATKSSDFFSISTCRDLLFHVQEHRMSLTGIDAFLGAHKLTFLGFEVEPDVVQNYKKRFPGDPAAVNLAQWQRFENDNPDTFFGMYQFWVQKAS